MSSASMLQAKLIPHLPSEVGERFKELSTNAQRAIQFTRSTPGLTTALVGMSRVEHVEENMETAKVPPAPLAEYMKLFKQA
jgi:aryl-alcohol dehydrogenase-like predicted oxidoreductase